MGGCRSLRQSWGLDPRALANRPQHPPGPQRAGEWGCSLEPTTLQEEDRQQVGGCRPGRGKGCDSDSQNLSFLWPSPPPLTPTEVADKPGWGRQVSAAATPKHTHTHRHTDTHMHTRARARTHPGPSRPTPRAALNKPRHGAPPHPRPQRLPVCSPKPHPGLTQFWPRGSRRREEGGGGGARLRMAVSAPSTPQSWGRRPAEGCSPRPTLWRQAEEPATGPPWPTLRAERQLPEQALPPKSRLS